MTNRESVLAERPEAVAGVMQGEAHCAEACGRLAHWEVRGGPESEAALLGAGDDEETAWAEAAGVLLVGMTHRGTFDQRRPLSPVKQADGAAPGEAGATETPQEAGQREMQERVAGHAAGGADQIDRRIEELAPRPGSAAERDAQERCALKALRGDFEGLPALAHLHERAEVAKFEGEGGRAPESDEEAAHDRNDRNAVAGAVDAARR